MRYSESTMLYNEIRMPSSESIQDVYLIFGGRGELPSIRGVGGWGGNCRAEGGVPSSESIQDVSLNFGGRGGGSCRA